jgi:hypothetical protein
LPSHARGARALYLSGVHSLAFSVPVLVLAWPDVGALVWTIGGYALFTGALLLALGPGGGYATG